MNKILRYSFSAATDIGQRDENQDCFSAESFMSQPGEKSYCISTVTDDSFPALFSVSDGVGSLEDSAQTSFLTLKLLNEKIESFDIDSDPVEWAVISIDEIHQHLLDYMYSTSVCGANTLSCLLLTKEYFLYSNIGDSPGFILKDDGVLTELSIRHNLETYKKLTGQEIEEGDSSFLLYCFDNGNTKLSDIANIWEDELKPGDKFLLCSDGITNALNEEEITLLLKNNAPASEFVKKAAKIKGADNCTAIVIYVN